MESSARPQRRGSAALVVVAALLPLVPILAGLVITSGSVAAAPIAPGGYRALASAPSSATSSPGSSLPGGSGALVALVLRGTTMRVSPGGRALAAVGRRTGFGSPQALWVLTASRQWLGVVSPAAGNGRLGWIPRSATSLERVGWELRVSLSARRLTVIEDGSVVQRYTVAVGRPSAPTPTGRFAVTDRLATGDPTGPYGCCILALSALSPHAIQGWSGGNRIAIHSTPDTGSIGQPVSHGCVRVTLAQGRWLMNHVPLGTPTLIRS